MPQPTLSAQTQDSIDRDLSPHVVNSAGTVLASLGALFQLLSPILIKILQDFATTKTVPTVANVFAAGHALTAPE
jgi:hypothetical protein